MLKRKDPNALDKLRKKFEKIAAREVAVGFPKGKARAYPDGTSVVDVAAAHVYGVGVPVRDFMGFAAPAIEEKTKPLLRAMVKLSPDRLPELQALQGAAGEAAKAAIQQAIIDLDDPPNAPATIARKKSSNPLIDTGHMKDSVDYVVRDKK